jgi:hypothetical protein
VLEQRELPMFGALASDIALDTGALVKDDAAAISRSRGVTVGGHSSTIPSIVCEAATLPRVMSRSRFLLMTYQATIEWAALASAVVSR